MARKYFNQHLLNVEPKCATDTQYPFFAQYYTEAQQIQNNITIAFRQGKGHVRIKGDLNAGKLAQSEEAGKLLAQNNGFQLLSSVHGSSPYWEKALTDLFAMVRSLGIPTWFVTFRGADLHWPESIISVGKSDWRWHVQDGSAGKMWMDLAKSCHSCLTLPLQIWPILWNCDQIQRCSTWRSNGPFVLDWISAKRITSCPWTTLNQRCSQSWTRPKEWSEYLHGQVCILQATRRRQWSAGTRQHPAEAQPLPFL